MYTALFPNLFRPNVTKFPRRGMHNHPLYFFLSYFILFFSIFIPIPIYQKFCNQNFVLTQLLYHLKKLAEEPKAQFKTSLQTGISLSRFIISPLFYGNIQPFIFPDLPPTRLELVLEIDA